MLLYALTIFGSAFLLFLVQPIVAKQILPWFGGSAAVWATCLVFFQTTLLLGYAYADYTVRRFSARGQVRLHVALLAVSLVTLPIVPGAFWKPGGDENPVWLILALLFGTIGLPYFLLSTTSPLVQVWFARRFPGRNPYRLFALSNFASLLGLLGYPFLLEPWVATRMQAWGWSAGYALFVGLAAAAAFASLGKRGRPEFSPASGDVLGPGRETRSQTFVFRRPAAPSCRTPPASSGGAGDGVGAAAVGQQPHHAERRVGAAAVDRAAVPVPARLTFILCFDGSGWYRRDVMLAMLAAALGVMAWTYADPSMTHELAIQVGVFCAGLFLACMFCHGELVRLKPAPAHLTRFYLMISLGGALGAALVGIAAPLVMPADFELPVALAVCALLLLWQVRREAAVYGVLALTALFVTIGCGVWAVVEFYESAIVVSRNFYGVLRVQETGTGPDLRRQLVHGNIMHGKQFLDADLKGEPSSYYTRSSGVGRVIEALHPRADPIKVGIIGLGTGTIATYGSKGDVYRFYDINPGVVEIAQRDFSYLRDSDATIELPLGDARLKLEREDPQGFDVLAIDAFSSDAIPVHLITREAVQVYLRHMKPDGVVAFHVTNRYLDLVPVVEGIAHELALAVLWINDPGADALGNSSSWVLIAKDPARLADPKLVEASSDITPRRDWRVWTDDFNNLVQAEESEGNEGLHFGAR